MEPFKPQKKPCWPRWIALGVLLASSLWLCLETYNVLPPVLRRLPSHAIPSKPSPPPPLPAPIKRGVNELKLPQDGRIVDMTIAPMTDFKGKTKSEILAMRTARVNEHADLLARAYVPSPEVFGQIVDGKPWWGIEGIFRYGDGLKSIEGPSEESRFILNPFLLIAVMEAWAMRKGTTDTEYMPEPEWLFPKPEGLTWKLGQRPSAYVEYHASELLHILSSSNGKEHEGELALTTYNAQDFGFNYLYLDPERSYSVTAMTPGKVVPLVQFIHVGQSCQYPGGCNNGSPHQPEAGIKMGRDTGIAYFKLWRQAPQDLHQPEDMTFIIAMVWE